MVTIIICTHNRCAVLKDCINSFIKQSETDFKLLIIDNNSSDETPKYGVQWAKDYSWIEYDVCLEIGLSNARNKGAALATTEWVGYIDDDAIVTRNFMKVVNAEIKVSHYDAFGGVYYPWYREGRPFWFSDRWGGNYHGYVERGRRELNATEYFSGGIAFYKKKWINTSQGFDPRFGMKGESIGYGEENVFQDLIRSNGGKLGINPEIKMKHLVASYKLKLMWHMRAQFENGRSSIRRQQCHQPLILLFVYSICAPVLSMRNITITDFPCFAGVLGGSLVTWLRSQSYYAGRMYQRLSNWD